MDRILHPRAASASLRRTLAVLVGTGLLGCREMAAPDAGAPSAARVSVQATTGFAAEAILSTTAVGYGWEPAVAADPGSGYVYAAWMQNTGTRIQIALRVSADGGGSWTPATPICGSCGQSQADIVLATTSSGAVYATWMQQNRISFSQSADHGVTWSTPINVSGGTWADKPWLAASADGRHVYIAWTTRGNLFAAVSHDGGVSFAPPRQLTNESRVYFFANGAAVLPSGTALIVAAGYPGQSNSKKLTGSIPITVLRTVNGGTAWTRQDADVLHTGVGYATSSVATVASDGYGKLLLVYSGSTAVGARGQVWVRRSADGGVTWGPRVEMTTSANGADATSVAAVGRGDGDFRISWMDARNGGWNVYERESTGGGQTWSADALVSTATSGAPYKMASGFGLPFGDYHMMAITSAGKTVVVMGEGDATQSNGDVWVNRQR